jgi:hypothetical protein
MFLKKKNGQMEKRKGKKMAKKNERGGELLRQDGFGLMVGDRGKGRKG